MNTTETNGKTARIENLEKRVEAHATDHKDIWSVINRNSREQRQALERHAKECRQSFNEHAQDRQDNYNALNGNINELREEIQQISVKLSHTTGFMTGVKWLVGGGVLTTVIVFLISALAN